MNLKKIDFKLVGAAVLFIAAIACYWVCANKVSEDTQKFKNENESLQTEVDYLQDLMNNKQHYIDETERMSGEIAQITSEFPADVKPETQIMYINDLELGNDMVVQTLNMPGKEIVMLPDTEPVGSSDTATDDAADDSAESEDVPVDDTVTAPTGSAMASSVLLYRNPTTITYKTTYKSVKQMLKGICEDKQNKKSIESVTLARDEATGNLDGSMTLALYSLDGTDNVYAAPSVKGVVLGTDNIFKSQDNVNSLHSTTTAVVDNADSENSDDKDNADDKKDDDKKDDDSKSDSKKKK